MGDYFKVVWRKPKRLAGKWMVTLAASRVFWHSANGSLGIMARQGKQGPRRRDMRVHHPHELRHIFHPGLVSQLGTDLCRAFLLQALITYKLISFRTST